MVGAIDVATTTIETPEEVTDTLRKALQFVDADKLYPCKNCGMAPLSRWLRSVPHPAVSRATKASQAAQAWRASASCQR